MKTIAIINHKGGVAKTTSTVNIGAGLALKGYKVLLIDADPQANLSQSLGIFQVEQDIYTAFTKGKSLPIIKVKENLFVVPSSLDFAGIELEIASRIDRDKLLLELLEPEQKQYDYCLIDCPPSLGLITVNALVASQEIYIPIVAEYLPFKGIDSIVGFIEKVKKHLNKNLLLKGVFFTRFNSKKVLSKQINVQIEKSFGSTLMETVIRENVALAECPSAGIDIFEYDKASNGAADYEKLVDEILKKK